MSLLSNNFEHANLYFRCHPKSYSIQLLVLVLLLPVLLSSSINSSVPSLYLPQGYVISALSDKGYNPSVLTTPTTLGCSNPAAMVDLRRGFGLTYQWNSAVNPAWSLDFGHRRIFNAIPQSIGLSGSIRDLHLGIAMNQIYNSETDYGELLATVVAPNNQGYVYTGTYRPKKEETIYRYSLSASYYLNSAKTIALGLNYNQNQLNFSYHLNLLTTDAPDSINFEDEGYDQKTYAGNISAGIRYNTPAGTFPRLKAGIFFESEVRFRHSFYYYSEKLNLATDIPTKIHSGIYFELPSGLFFSEDVSYLLWEQTQNSYLKNQPEVAVNAGFPVSRNLILSGGAFYGGYHRTDFTEKENGKFRAVYLMLGGIYHFKDFSLELTCADSHLFSGEYRKLTILKTGIGYTF